jgi:hypothetical protein
VCCCATAGSATYQQLHLLLCAAAEQPYVSYVAVGPDVHTLQTHHVTALARGAEITKGPYASGTQDRGVVHAVYHVCYLLWKTAPSCKGVCLNGSLTRVSQ